MTKTRSKKKVKKKTAEPAAQEFPDTPWGHQQRQKAEAAAADGKADQSDTE